MNDSGRGAAATEERLKAQPSPVTDGRRDLREILSDLIHHELFSQPELEAELERLCGKHGDTVYSELLYILTHLRFSSVEAQRQWQGISQHRCRMQSKLGKPVDPRVALVDYFLEVEPRLSSPMIIETSLFARTRDSAYRDELTTLHNYRHFTEQLDREIAHSSRQNAPLSLLMIDVDGFKDYNDCCGHLAGNAVLTRIARLLIASVRDDDTVTRYGGDEFAIILPATPKIAARALAESIRATVECEIRHEGSPTSFELTVSIGLATFPADANSADDLVSKADQALYASKAAGKNRVLLYAGSSRSHRRADLVLRGGIRMLSSERRELTTITIGDGGMQFLSNCELSPGSLVELELALPTSEEIRIPARVLRTRQTEGDVCVIAVETTELGRANRRLLAEYLPNRLLD